MDELENTNINYQYFVQYIKQMPGWESLKILDFGCGNGTVVNLLRQENIDCYGADIFYEGASYENVYKSKLFKDKIIRLIPENGELPFENNFFDIIISNSVFEHIKNKDLVFTNLLLLLNTSGFMYHHFPTREVIREEHIGILLVHWLPKNNVRYLYTVILRSIGFGYFKSGLSVTEWAKKNLEWLDKYCFYDKYTDLFAILTKKYIISHREIDYCRFRAKNNPLLRFILSIDLLKEFYQQIFRRLGFIAIELRHRDTSHEGDMQ